MNVIKSALHGGVVRALALYSKGQRFKPQHRRFFTPKNHRPPVLAVTTSR